MLTQCMHARCMHERNAMSEHKMTLTSSQDGIDEWYCLTCGRTLLIDLEEKKITVKAVGDELASHSGGNNISLRFEIEVVDNTSELDRMLDDMGFDKLWDL